MVFCNNIYIVDSKGVTDVTILILIDGFLQCKHDGRARTASNVTILILIDGFLQYCKIYEDEEER